MSIVSADIEYRYSGGAGNTDPAAALGGAMSTAGGGTIDDNVANDLWANVTSAQASAGATEYRGFYIKNAHATLTFQDARLYISSDTTSATEELDIGIAAEAVDVNMATIANGTTAPTAVVFTHPASYAAGLQLNSSTGLAAASKQGVWIRRTVTAGTTAVTGNTGTLRAEGYTS
jgi:hypothetical protein